MYNLFIGRWSPFHEGHKYIIDSFVNNGKKVCIGIRDTQMSEKDPFPAELRKKLIEEYYKNNENVKVIIIPDISNVCIGRNVGYSIMEVPEKIKKVSGTQQRELKAKNWNDGNGHVFWFTGMPCSGKTTLMNAIAKHLNYDYVILDGDTFRKNVTPHLGFSEKDRYTNIETAAHIARTLKNHGVIVLAGFVSPSKFVRDMARRVIFEDFSLIHVKNDAEECAKRDVKGMWAKAKAGEIKNFTGFDAPYEEPTNADLVINTKEDVETCVQKIKAYFKKVL